MSPDCNISALVSQGVAQQDTSSATDERGWGLPPLRNNCCHGLLQTCRLPADWGTSTKKTETDGHWRINKYRRIKSFKGTLLVADRDFPPVLYSLSAELIWHDWNEGDGVSGLHSSQHFLLSNVFRSGQMKAWCWGVNLSRFKLREFSVCVM